MKGDHKASNNTGMQLLHIYFLWVWHCLHAVHCAVEPKGMHCDGDACREESGGYVRRNTERVVARKGGNIVWRFIDSG